MITNSQSGTNVHEIGDGIYRINTRSRCPAAWGTSVSTSTSSSTTSPCCSTRDCGSCFRGARSRRVADAGRKLSYVGFSHFESDECGALNSWLAVAPRAVAVCSQVAALVSGNDFADRAPRGLADGEELSLGRHRMRWFDTPHMPHGWDCGLIMDMSTRTFFCGDLFTQGGPGEVALTESDIFGPSEAFRAPMDYFAHAPQTGAILERLAREAPTTLACMHGSAWRGDGAKLLRQLSASLAN
jgi:flavorubredoxin